MHDGSAALEAAEGYRPEVILLDIGMPGVNGFEVARRLRELGRIPGLRPRCGDRKPVELSEIQRAILLNGTSSTKH